MIFFGSNVLISITSPKCSGHGWRLHKRNEASSLPLLISLLTRNERWDRSARDQVLDLLWPRLHKTMNRPSNYKMS